MTARILRKLDFTRETLAHHGRVVGHRRSDYVWPAARNAQAKPSRKRR